MDYVQGTDAANLLRDQGGGGLPPEDVVRIVSGVADALDYAHQQELLHRDVKPSNILLAQSNSPKFSRALLADFGIARWVQDSSGLTATDMTVGTVAYAAPEQLMGHALDGRADQYALAASAFHLITGGQLFQHDNPAVVISNHLTAQPPAIGDRIPELSGLGPAFDKALAKAPADRYETCTAFAEAMAEGLSAAAQELGATDATAPAFPTPRGTSVRKRIRDRAGCGWVYWRRGSSRCSSAGRLRSASPWGNGRSRARNRRLPRRGDLRPAGGADRCRLRDPRCCWAHDGRAAGVLLAIAGDRRPRLVDLPERCAGSDGHARPHGRGVSGRHRASGPGLRE